MALSQTNISVAVVQSAIGVFSTSSVGGLIAKALSGGVGGYAFYINETYGTTGRRDGYLIPGAKPHWNMYSNKIPAEWFNDAGNGNTLNLRMRRNALNSNGGYDFRLHDFRGYEHSAVTHPKPNLWATGLAVWEGSSAEVTARFFSNYIDLSTANRSGGALTHYLLVFRRNSTDYTSAVIPIDNSGVDVPTHTFTPASDTEITITVYLLPTNVDTARVLMPIDFYTVNDTEVAVSKVTVRVMLYPVLSVDTSTVYQYSVDIEAVLNDTWAWGDGSYTEGIAFITDSGGTILPTVKINNNGTNNPLNQAMYIRFWGNVGGTRTFKAYRNGVQIGSTVTRNVLSAPNSTGYGVNVNFGATGFDIQENDVFEIIVT